MQSGQGVREIKMYSVEFGMGFFSDYYAEIDDDGEFFQCHENIAFDGLDELESMSYEELVALFGKEGSCALNLQDWIEALLV